MLAELIDLPDFVDIDLAESLLIDFKIGPILPLRGGPPRFYWADLGEPERWTEVVLERWPGCREFLAGAPHACRRMVDTDGEHAEIYLDDLQDHGAVEMCRVFRTVTAGVDRFVPCAPPDQPLAEHGGKWAERLRGEEHVSWLWVTEARWKGTASLAIALVETLYNPLWKDQRRVAEAEGWRLYPDAVEIHADGRVDLTLGFLPSRS